MTEDEVVGWHHRHNGHEFEQALGGGEGQGGLVHCSPWSRQARATEQQQNEVTVLGRNCRNQTVGEAEPPTSTPGNSGAFFLERLNHRDINPRGTSPD